MLTLLLLNILELTQNYIGIFFLSFLYFPSNDVGLFVKFLPHARHGPEYPIEPISWLICLLHHIPSLIAYILRENRDFVFIIIVQFMMSSNSRMRFGLQIVFVCLYIASSNYHHCTNLFEDIELIKMPVRYILSSMWVRLSIFSQLSIIQYMGLYGFSWPISLVMIERIYTLSYHHHQIANVNYYPLFRVRSWNNGVHCKSLYILMAVDGLATHSPEIFQDGQLIVAWTKMPF